MLVLSRALGKPIIIDDGDGELTVSDLLLMVNLICVAP